MKSFANQRYSANIKTLQETRKQAAKARAKAERAIEEEVPFHERVSPRFLQAVLFMERFRDSVNNPSFIFTGGRRVSRRAWGLGVLYGASFSSAGYHVAQEILERELSRGARA